MNILVLIKRRSFRTITGVVMVCVIFMSQSCSHRLRGGKERPYVILMAGQSNMVGQGAVEEREPLEIPPNVEYYNLNRKDLQPNPKWFGPEVGVMEMLGARFPQKRFIVLKFAVGGSSLLDWAPDYDSTKAVITGHPEFGNLFKDFMHGVDSLTANRKVRFLALLWMQGERDAKVPEAGKDYYDNFSAFVKAARSHTSRKLPVVYGLVNPDPTKYPALEIVRAAQRRFAADDRNAYLVETSALEKRRDKIHYSTAGQLLLGKLFGNELMPIINDQ